MLVYFAVVIMCSSKINIADVAQEADKKCCVPCASEAGSQTIEKEMAGQTG